MLDPPQRESIIPPTAATPGGCREKGSLPSREIGSPPREPAATWSSRADVLARWFAEIKSPLPLDEGDFTELRRRDAESEYFSLALAELYARRRWDLDAEEADNVGLALYADLRRAGEPEDEGTDESEATSADDRILGNREAQREAVQWLLDEGDVAPDWRPYIDHVRDRLLTAKPWPGRMRARESGPRRPRSARRRNTGSRATRAGPDDDSGPHPVGPSPPGGGRLGVPGRSA
jgi:hypothetical protein